MGLSLHCVSSGERTKKGVILIGPSYLVAVTLIPATGVNCCAEVKDSTTDVTAKCLGIIYSDATVDDISSKPFCPSLPIRADNGIYLVLTGAGAKALVHCFSEDGSAIVAEAE